MDRWKRTTCVLVTVALVFSLGVPGAEGARKRKKLRAEIAELRAKIAQLESETSFLKRREGRLAPPASGGLCADPCALDSDGDGRNDCEDLCPCDPGDADRDTDGVPDCLDPCPEDATDACIDPCRMDADQDGQSDCIDPCPYSASGATDGDQDGIPDCADPCPTEADNDCTTPCPLDSDGDGMKDCVDPCPWGAATGLPCTWPPLPTCQRSGCSGQVCADTAVATTCEWREEYGCYRSARCERQPDGQCGWTPTEELRRCLGGGSGTP